MNQLLHGDCIEVMRTLPDNSIDSIVTDPPYGLGFMGKAWDALPPGKEWAEECLRVLKPGGHPLAFGGTRTWHRLAVAVEDAGFEIRDSIAWMYGSGFPKSQDVAKFIDKVLGGEREKVRKSGAASAYSANAGNDRPWMQLAREQGFIEVDGNTPATPEAQQWEGWGTALKPAFEPVVVGRKPFPGTVAANVLEHGTGALNIDGCRIGEGSGKPAPEYVPNHGNAVFGKGMGGGAWDDSKGRWPTNVMLDEYIAADLTAAPYFYVAKAPKKERPVVDGVAHATVKPLALMRYLVRLVTPAGGTVLEPFAGSGTTVEAAMLEGFQWIAIEREADYLPLIQARIDRATTAMLEELL